jgi:hypothetical protein
LGPGLAGQGDEIGARPEAAVLLDWHHLDRSGPVIGGDDEPVAWADRQIHRILAAAGLPVERRQPAARFVDRIGADLVEIGVDLVEKPLVIVYGEKPRIGDGDQLHMCPPARGRIHPVDVDAVAMPLRSGVVKAPT